MRKEERNEQRKEEKGKNMIKEERSEQRKGKRQRNKEKGRI